MAAENSTQPAVSVLIPTYNRPHYLRLALASVLAQSFGDFEVIVQDNASVTDPAEVVAAFADPRVRCFRNASNLGTTGNVVAASRSARGKYIAILGDDDLWEPGFLATLVAPLEADPSLILAFCDHGIIDGEGRAEDATTERVTRRFHRHTLREGIYRPFDDIALVLRSICVISGSVLRRDAIDWDAIPVAMRFGVDLYIAYLAARTGQGCYYVPHRLAQYRYHAGSVGSSLAEVQQKIDNARDSLFYWDRLRHDGSLTRNKSYFELKAGLNVMVIATALARTGQARAAWQELRRAWSAGIVRPRMLAYHLIYAVRLHRATA